MYLHWLPPFLWCLLDTNPDIQHEAMTIVTVGVLADYRLERGEGRGGGGGGGEKESGVKWEGRREIWNGGGGRGS